MSLRKRKDKRQGILPFVYERGEREEVTARAGLPLVVEISRALRLEQVAEKVLPPLKKEKEFTQIDKLEALEVLIAAGGDRVEDIRILNEDKGLVRLLGKEFPSPDALLDFLNLFHDDKCWANRSREEKAFVPLECVALQGLHQINHALVLRAADPKLTTATIDHDGTIIESHKRGTTIAYEGTRGYQPLVAVWAEQSLVVSDEFRDANVPGGMDPLSSVKRAFGTLPSWVRERYLRGDSADYYQPLLKYLVDEKIGFTISADMTQSLRHLCLKVKTEDWKLLEKRERDQVEWAEVDFFPGDWPKDSPALRYVVLKITPLQLEMFEDPSIKFLAVVSNRWELSAPALVKWHWGKAGTIEHVHKVLKAELSAGIMPSSRYGANAAWLRINILTFNLLTALKRIALPKRFQDARPKCLRFHLFTLPAKLSCHQNLLTARLSASDIRIQEIIDARGLLLEKLEQSVATAKPPAAASREHYPYHLLSEKVDP